MMENGGLDETYHVSARLYKRHIDFLNNINQNQSLALRTLLDSIMSGDEQIRKKSVYDNSIIYLCFGFFFFIITSLLQAYSIVYMVSVLLGTFLLAYGGIGGLQIVIQRAKHNK